jgi:3-isopropylmalate dehydrogenase
LNALKATIALLPGDGIGPEVVGFARQVLEDIATKYGHTFTFKEALFGDCATDATGQPLPPETIKICEESDAALMGAVGGPAGGTQWVSEKPRPRPEQGLLDLRSHFKCFANLRPVKVFPVLKAGSPLKPELLEGVDILFIRELTGGAYFGPKKEQGDGEEAYDTMLYTVPEVKRVMEVAFKAAAGRKKTLTSVDKANVLASSRLWRKTVDSMKGDYPEITVEHALVDSFAMQMLRTPARYDVVVAENMFGDILTDESAVLAGSLGMLPSASLGATKFGLYEPIHGSAPDIAGKGIANPTGTILSAAMLLRHSLGLDTEARAIEDAVNSALDKGARTKDIAGPGETAIGSALFASAVRDALKTQRKSIDE